MPLQAKKLERDLRGESGSETEKKFVWGKKIEKQIQEGRTLEDLGPEAERKRHEERLVSPREIGILQRAYIRDDRDSRKPVLQ